MPTTSSPSTSGMCRKPPWIIRTAACWVVSDHMTRDPETMSPDDTTEQAAVLMIHGGFRHMPLVEGDKVVGVLSIRDLMKVVLDNAAPRGV